MPKSSEPSKNESFHVIISVAGKREHAKLAYAIPLLREIFSALEHASGIKGRKLKLYLQTGLADGADMEAADALLRWEHDEKTEISLTGILPYNTVDYTQTIKEKKMFGTLYEKCSRKIILDGRYLPGDEPFPKECRSRAYRQQADFLLQACDVLLAITDETETIKAGSTLETVGFALKKEIPVIFLSLKQVCFFWLTKPEDMRKLASVGNLTFIKQPDELSQAIFNQVCNGKLEN